MKTDVTWEFEGAKEKGLKVFYDDDLSCFDVRYGSGKWESEQSFYDEPNEAGDASNGVAVEEVKKFIREF